MTNLTMIIISVLIIIAIFAYIFYTKKDNTFARFTSQCISEGNKVILLTDYQQVIYKTNGKSLSPSFVTHYIIGCKGNYSNAPINSVYDTTNKIYAKSI